MLTRVCLHHFKFPTVAYCGIFVSFYVFLCHALGWLHFIPVVSQPLIGVAQFSLRCPTSTSLENFTLFNAPYCRFLGLLCVTLHVPLRLTKVALYCSMFCMSAQWVALHHPGYHTSIWEDKIETLSYQKEKMETQSYRIDDCGDSQCTEESLALKKGKNHNIWEDIKGGSQDLKKTKGRPSDLKNKRQTPT